MTRINYLNPLSLLFGHSHRTMTNSDVSISLLSDRASLAICLNHPQTQLRIEALQRLREGIKSKQVLSII